MEDLKPIISLIIEPALSLLPREMDSAKARIMLLAIGLQESRLIHRRQIGGPANGLWQFERGGGVKGVLSHDATKAKARALCAAVGVAPNEKTVYEALVSNDRLAAGFARLLLWSDPAALPGTAEGGWSLYLRTWRPGKPHPETWQGFYEQASQAVMG